MTQKGKYYRYNVLYGSEGISKEYPSAKMAEKVAQKLKKSGFKGGIEVDRITIYPHAKAGQMDWSQGVYKTVKKFKGIKY